MANYLIFGIWLDEAQDGTDSFGAFASGGEPFTADNVANALESTVRYSGLAAGVHHKTDDGVSWFEGDANLSAKSGDDSTPGTIGGTIDNIPVAGGGPMGDSVHLVEAGLVDTANTFNGAAAMGRQQGAWSGVSHLITAPGALVSW